LGEEKREINVVQIQPEQFLAQVKPNDDAIKSYYDTHQAEFQLPEQVRVEYVVLSLDELINQSHVSDEEVTKYFNEHKDEFGQAEERRASHILISAPATASDAEKAAARAKAEQLADEIRKTPQRFEDLAREHSQDPGSAAKGGDLGFFPRNSMVKTFEDAVFQMKLDEISDVVETEHGFHIIKLAGIKGAEQISLDKVRNQVEQEVKRQKAEKMFGEMAEGFGNIVYEQSDSLQPAAENFNLPVQKSEWIARDAGEPPYFSNERLREAIFSDDAIKDKRNTEAIEVSPNVLVAARVVDHRPASMPPVTALKDKIAGLIARQEAAKAAVNEGKEKLEQLQAGKDGIVKWGAAQQVSRTDPQGLDSEILRAIFKIEATQLPSYTGVANSRGGFTLVRVGRVIESASPDPAERKAFAEQLQQLLAQQELASYLAGVRKRYDVSVKNENLEK
jgi:peptidyl-prolyl cis-trans isomerase D